MLKNYLTIAWRNIRKHKLYSIINIFGLAIGLACCLLIFLHLQDELSFDSFHQKSDRIYRVLESRTRSGQEARMNAYTMGALGPAMQAALPEVTGSARFFRGWRLTVKNTEPGIIMRDYLFSDSGFFELFDFPLIHGEARSALTAPNSVVLTESIAHKLFGEANPVGQILRVEAEDFPEFGEQPFKVTGVLQDLPGNSHLQFELLISFSSIDRFEGWARYLSSWEAGFVLNYLLLEKNASLAKVQSTLEALNHEHRGEETADARPLTLQPLQDIHFYSQQVTGEVNAEEGDLTYIYIFAVIALFILLIACINYMNLATARSLRRAREVGLRKVVGAARKQLVLQFLGESVITTFVAMLLAIGFLELVLQYVPDIAGKNLSLQSALTLPVVLGLLAVVLIVGIAAGLYPAFYLARYQAITVLKNSVRKGLGEVGLRRVLVVTQFALSIIMIAVTLVVYSQLEFIRSKNLGFSQQRLAAIDINHDDVQSNFLAVKTELQRLANVRSVTVSSRVPGDWKPFRSIEVAREGDSEEEMKRLFFNGVDEDFLSTFEIDLVAGRNFDRQLASDSAAVLLNETAARQLFGDDALDQRLEVPDFEFSGRVVGVIRDFNFHSLHNRIEPLMLGFMPASGRHPIHGIDYFTLRLSGANMSETIEAISRVHGQFDPVNPIELAFLEDWIEVKYQKDERVGRLFGLSAGLAILIACIGLFGLAAFAAEQRTKEIGVRKVLGATVGNVTALLSKDFVKLVLIANVLAWPVAWYAMQKWLENFAYRTEIVWWVFVVAGGTALVIAQLTVSYQSIRAALANPVEALKYE